MDLTGGPNPWRGGKPSAAVRISSRANTWAYFAVYVSLGLGLASLGPTLPGLARQTHAHLAAISFLFTARSLGYVVGCLWLARLFDQLRGNPLLGANLFLMSITLAVTPFFSKLPGLALNLFVLGISEAMIDVGANTLLVWTHREKVGPFMNALHFFFGIGALVSPILVAIGLRLEVGIALAYWILAALLIAPAVWTIRLPSPIPQLNGSALEAPGKASLILLIAIFYFFYAGAEVSFGGWIFSYATVLCLAPEAQAAFLTSLFWAALTAGRLATIPLAKKFRPRAILTTNLTGGLVASILLWTFANSPVVLWVGTAGMGLAMSSVFPTILALAERRMAINSRIARWFFLGAGVGGMLVPWFIGQLFEKVGAPILMLTLQADLLLALLTLGILLWRAPHQVRKFPVSSC